MTNGEQEAVLTFEPVFVPESEIIIPLEKIYPKPEVPYVPTPVPVEKKGLVLNIETSGFDPMRHRIIAIGVQDPLLPDLNPTVIMLEDEESMISALFTVLSEGGYDELIGYGLAFDYRFIFIKALKYGLSCKEFVDCSLWDVMQVITQVKQAFVYYPQKALDLSDLADYLWAYPKPFTDTEMLKYWAAGESDKVLEFTSSQITRILVLYLLTRHISETLIVPFAPGGGSSGSEVSYLHQRSTSSKLTIPEANPPEFWTYKCNTCLAEEAVPAGTLLNRCRICGGGLSKI